MRSDTQYKFLSTAIAPYWLWDIGQLTLEGGIVVSPTRRAKGRYVVATVLQDERRRPVRLYKQSETTGTYYGETPDLRHRGTRAYLVLMCKTLGIEPGQSLEETVSRVAAEEVSSYLLLRRIQEAQRHR